METSWYQLILSGQLWATSADLQQWIQYWKTKYKSSEVGPGQSSDYDEALMLCLCRACHRTKISLSHSRCMTWHIADISCHRALLRYSLFWTNPSHSWINKFPIPELYYCTQQWEICFSRTQIAWRIVCSRQSLPERKITKIIFCL